MSEALTDIKAELIDLLTEKQRRLNGERFDQDLEYFAAERLKIRAKSKAIVPLIFNRAQRFIHEKLEAQFKTSGRVRAIILKGRQEGCCYTPDMRVLTADYRWVQIDEVQPGDRLTAVDEDIGEINRAGRRKERRIRIAVVEAAAKLRREVFEVELENGVILKATAKHRHLCRQRGGDRAQWREVAAMQVGDVIRQLTPVETGEDFEDGWMSGMLDGEGSFGAHPQARISLSQVDGPVLQRAREYLRSREIGFYESIDDRTPGDTSKLGTQAVHRLRVDRMSDVIRLLALTRPSRFVGRELLVGKKLPKSAPGFSAWAEVLSIRSIGIREVVDLQTSEKTFICEGMVSHNSTYVAARYYGKTSRRHGIRTYILTHENQATQNLFAIVDRFHQNMPDAERASISASNAIELVFDELDSGYVVGTAGTKGTGRSQTIQLFHGSEVAFWSHAETHGAGIIQGVPSEDGTEIILESTANGMGNYFHKAWRDAETGASPYQAIFIPWFWDEGYRERLTDGFVLDEDEREYQALYALTPEQMAWRRTKIAELKDPVLFQQEYPSNAAEAFQMSGRNSFIQPRDVLRARKTTRSEAGPLVIGFDPSGGSGADSETIDEVKGDRASMAWRRGRKVRKVTSKRGMNTMEMAGWAHKVIKEDRPARMFIDVGGAGRGIYDRLVEMGDGGVVRLVNFGSKPFDPPPLDEQGKPFGGPFNRRAEMWSKSRDWLCEEGGVDMPDSDSLQADACAPGYRATSLQQIVLERKEDIRARGMPSPDEWDAVALTFAEDVADESTGFGRSLDYPKRALY